jgi:hypothetical protein
MKPAHGNLAESGSERNHAWPPNMWMRTGNHYNNRSDLVIVLHGEIMLLVYKLHFLFLVNEKQ